MLRSEGEVFVSEVDFDFDLFCSFPVSRIFVFFDGTDGQIEHLLFLCYY